MSSGPGFYRGTSYEQTPYFANKERKMIESKNWPSCFSKKVDMSKVNLETMRPWISRQITQMLGVEDDIVIDYCMSQLKSEEGLLDGLSSSTTISSKTNFTTGSTGSNFVGGIPFEIDPKKLQINLTGFMSNNTGRFVKDLWELLLSAQDNPTGIPQQLLDEQKEEIRRKKEEQERLQEEIEKRQKAILNDDTSLPKLPNFFPVQSKFTQGPPPSDMFKPSLLDTLLISNPSEIDKISSHNYPSSQLHQLNSSASKELLKDVKRSHTDNQEQNKDTQSTSKAKNNEIGKKKSVRSPTNSEDSTSRSSSSFSSSSRSSYYRRKSSVNNKREYSPYYRNPRRSTRERYNSRDNDKDWYTKYGNRASHNRYRKSRYSPYYSNYNNVRINGSIRKRRTMAKYSSSTYSSSTSRYSSSSSRKSKSYSTTTRPSHSRNGNKRSPSPAYYTKRRGGAIIPPTHLLNLTEKSTQDQHHKSRNNRQSPSGQYHPSRDLKPSRDFHRSSKDYYQQSRDNRRHGNNSYPTDKDKDRKIQEKGQDMRDEAKNLNESFIERSRSSFSQREINEQILTETSSLPTLDTNTKYHSDDLYPHLLNTTSQQSMPNSRIISNHSGLEQVKHSHSSSFSANGLNQDCSDLNPSNKTTSSVSYSKNNPKNTASTNPTSEKSVINSSTPPKNSYTSGAPKISTHKKSNNVKSHTQCDRKILLQSSISHPENGSKKQPRRSSSTHSSSSQPAYKKLKYPSTKEPSHYSKPKTSTSLFTSPSPKRIFGPHDSFEDPLKLDSTHNSKSLKSHSKTKQFSTGENKKRRSISPLHTKNISIRENRDNRNYNHKKPQHDERNGKLKEASLNTGHEYENLLDNSKISPTAPPSVSDHPHKIKQSESFINHEDYGAVPSPSVKVTRPSPPNQNNIKKSRMLGKLRAWSSSSSNRSTIKNKLIANQANISHPLKADIDDNSNLYHNTPVSSQTQLRTPSEELLRQRALGLLNIHKKHQ